MRLSPVPATTMALARRLLVGIWVTLGRGEVFSLERCLGNMK